MKHAFAPSSLVACAEAIASGAVSPAELTEAALERIGRTSSPDAFSLVDAARTMARGHSLTEELRDRGPRGPLHGIPVAVSDVIDVVDLAGADDAVAQRDAAVVAMLRRAGAVILGTTVTHPPPLEAATASCANPWDATRVAGGGSGGSAIAVAVGVCALAVGTDTCGSVRIPAALCGVSGLGVRPSSLPRDGVAPLAPSMDALGLVAKTPADLAFAWGALHGLDAVPVSGPLRVGVPAPEVLGAVDPDVAALAEQALDLLGAERTAVVLPPFAAWARPQRLVFAADTRAVARIERRRDARSERAADDARRELADFNAALLRSLGAVDILAWPTTAMPAPTREPADGMGARARRQTSELSRLCGPVSVAGLAAVTVPCGLVAGRLPAGVQIVGRDETVVLGAAQRLDALAVGLRVAQRRTDQPSATGGGHSVVQQVRA